MTTIADQLDETDGVPAEILQRRLDQERIDVVEEAVRFARAVRDRAAEGISVDTYRNAATDLLLANLPIANEAWDGLAERTDFPETDLSAAEQAARNRSFRSTHYSPASVSPASSSASSSFSSSVSSSASSSASRCRMPCRILPRV